MREQTSSNSTPIADAAPVAIKRAAWRSGLWQHASVLLVLLALAALLWQMRLLTRAVEGQAADLAALRTEAQALAEGAKALPEEAARTTAAVRELTRSVNPKYDHVVCPARGPGHPEVDLGVLTPCPNPDDGQCVRGDIPMSVAQARCAAGKLQ